MTPEYLPNFIDNTDKIFQHLLGLNWLQETEARQEYFMSDVPRSYAYGKGDYEREYHSSPYSDEVLEIQNKLNAGGNQYNVCFLNRYNHQHHALGWHADDSPTMDREHPIAVVSFGAEREIWWKEQAYKGPIPKENRQKLGNGSLFVMPALFQDSYFHKIPKCDHVCDVRISLTFRRYL